MSRDLSRRTGPALAAAVAFCLSGWPVATAAFDTQLKVSAPKDLVSLIEAGSLVLAAERDSVTATQDILAAAKADYRKILSLLYREGYYAGSISIRADGREVAELPPFDPPAQVRQIVITVNPGPAFRFGKVSIAPLAQGTALPSGFATGQPARSGAVTEAVGAAITGWRDAGYAKATPSGQKVVADHERAILDAAIAIAPGPKVKFGKLTITGTEKVRTQRILEIAGYPARQVYSPAELERVAKRLRKTGAFRSVSISEAETLGPDNELDIALALLDEKPRRIGFGAEISSTQGVGLSAFWLHRNILGGAEQLRFDGAISGIGATTGGIDYSLSARFTRPGSFNPDNVVFAFAEIAQLDEPEFLSKQIKVEIGIDREINERTSMGAALQYRFADVTDDFGQRKFNHLMLRLNGTHNTRDRDLDARRGYYLRAELSPYLGLSGSASGARFFADGRAYYTPGSTERLTLAGRLQVGSVMGSGLADTPPDLLFFSGGGGTVRGQPYQSLSIDLGGGANSGGASFLGFSAEARIRATEKIGVVAFADFGMIGAEPNPGEGVMHSGAGLGLRYETGIGPIRFDVATPVGGTTGKGIQIYVGIGQSF